MIDVIRDLKDALLEHMDKELAERGSVDRLDPDMVDMVKDLAEAEYYCTVTDAMHGNRGYSGRNYMRRGYDGHTSQSESVRNMLMMLSPEERQRIMNDMQNM